MPKKAKKQEVAVTEDLKNILAVLKPNDATELLRLKEELADNWNKKQIFRTETEMRVSVLNEMKFPTPAAKYWQSVREMAVHFDALMNLSFEMRRIDLKRLRLEKQMEEAIAKNDQLDIMEVQIELDQNLYNKAVMEQVAHDRVREIKTWSKIKTELDDGSFDTQEVNTHQAEALGIRFENKVKALNPNSEVGEVINALGTHQAVQKLKTENNTLLTFDQIKKLEQQK